MALDFPSSPTLNQVHVSGGIEWFWDGEAWVTEPRPAENGSAVNFPGSPSVNDVVNDAWIWDGAKWRATRPAFVPDDFTLPDKIDQEPSTTVTSAGVQITAARHRRFTPISITGGEYQTADDIAFSVNASSWTSSAGYIAQNQYVRVRHTPSSSFGTGASCTLTIGAPGETQSDTFNSTTRAAVDVFLTTPGPGSWPIPAQFNPASNYVECIGGGGNGGNAPGASWSAGGGGGGGYGRKNNLPLSPGTAPYVVGAAATPSWFSAPGTVRGDGGTSGSPAPATFSPGGAGGSGVGDVTFSGGNGGNGTGFGGPVGGGGGGGAANSGGNGGNGAVGAINSGGGGGSAGSSGAGSPAPGATGGAAGSGGGAVGGAASFNGGANGNNGTSMSPTAGAGSGGGGGPRGGAGGSYGGGGGGGGEGGDPGTGEIQSGCGGCTVAASPGASGSPGVGTQGLIFISYTPATGGKHRFFMVF